MKWEPIRLDALDEIIKRDLAACSDERRAFFVSASIPAAQWQSSHAESGGFWAVAVHDNRVLWYNDYEEGFNVSTFTTWGTIPDDEYWCNQDRLQFALPKLMTGVNARGDWGPPQPISSLIASIVQRALKLLRRFVLRGPPQHRPRQG